MVATVDGRIVSEGWPDPDAVRREYELVHEGYAADAWICGRVTMEPFAKRTRSVAEIERRYTGDTPRDDYRAPGSHDSFAFAIDSSGRIAWESNDIGGANDILWLRYRVDAAR